MGKKLIIPGITIDPSAPVLPSIDQAMPAAGTLVFIEPGHPYNPASGVALGSYLPNIAINQARAATGIVSTDDVAYKSRVIAMGANAGTVERSAKGGLHLIPAKTSPGGLAVSYSTTDRPAGEGVLATWLDGHKSDTFYIALWGRWTRALGTLVGSGYSLSAIGASNSLGQFFARQGSTGELAYPTDSRRLGVMAENIQSPTLAPFFIDAAFTAPAATSIPATFRPFALSPHTGDANSTPAAIFYDYIVEDLTISGRTYAQAHAAWFAKYTREVKTAGGRYYGDTTPTTPS